MLNASIVANSIVEPIYSKQIEEIEKIIVKEAKKGFVNCHYFNSKIGEEGMKALAGILTGYGYTATVISNSASYSLALSWNTAFDCERKSAKL